MARLRKLTSKGSFGAPDIENIQHGAIWRRLAGASGDCLREQAFKLPQVVEPGPDVFEMMRRDLTNLATRRFVGSAEPDQGADFNKRKSQLARPSYEAKDAEVRRVVDAAAIRRARGRGQH